MTLSTSINKSLNRDHFPGLSITVARREKILVNRSFGYRCLEPSRQILEPDTIYDLASLTKPLVTAFLILYLSERGEIKLTDSIRKYLPEISLPIRIDQLLTHTTGLPAWYPFYLYGSDYRSLFKRIQPAARPGRKVIYSCPGYILLFLLIEMIGGNFQQMARQTIFDPLRLERTFFKVPAALLDQTAPTERGNAFEKQLALKSHRDRALSFDWRRHLLHGETHDANSYYQNGTAGNAGLFSNGSDLARFTAEFFPDSASLLKADTVRLFWKESNSHRFSRRTLGFKLNRSLSSSGGRALPTRAIGHNGFTGTSVWLDPVNKNRYIILSNRVHPTVRPVNFNRIRRHLHSLLGEEVAGTL